MSNFHKLLVELKALYPIEADRGKAFEHVCQWFLENDGDYRDLFQNGSKAVQNLTKTIQ